MEPTPEQLAVCAKSGADAAPPAAGTKLGIALGSRDAGWPLQGIRHPAERGTNGWYVWWGPQSDAADFFQPLHVEHMPDRCPLAVPYLALPPGWGFQIAPGHEDVWYDAALLDA